ncbi:hypothetical protein [Sanguibacter suaedae]|uniref:Uncharacterized protein n=1 Tax=Sanguibacter suaedae TaxID=2795737 RepID=A0A934MC44_9MICO|nr:hypothetical protein [Sanguibacter suaedae]MBI9116006.1 hypothetical protein [Sanguibacter suaedae]
MTTHTNRKTFAAASGAAVLVATLLTGCGGGGGDLEAFCADVESVQSAGFLEDLDYTDSDAVDAAVADAREEVQNIEPPSDIEDDWETLSGAMDEMYGAMEGLDFTDPEQAEEMTAAMEKIDTEGVNEASDNVDAFIEEECSAAE